MTLDWLNIAALLGAAQGFFLASVLATQRRNRTANRLLAVAVFAFSIQMITVVYHAVVDLRTAHIPLHTAALWRTTDREVQ